MKIFLSSLTVSATAVLFMIVIASSHQGNPSQSNQLETISGTYSNPVNRTQKSDRRSPAKQAGEVKSTGALKGDYCSVGGFDRACKLRIADLKVSLPLIGTN